MTSMEDVNVVSTMLCGALNPSGFRRLSRFFVVYLCSIDHSSCALFFRYSQL